MDSSKKRLNKEEMIKDFNIPNTMLLLIELIWTTLILMGLDQKMDSNLNLCTE